MSIKLEHIGKQFGDFTAIDDISLEAEPGEFLALLGPSGSGKTTLLRIMAGLEFPDRGRVWFEGGEVTGLSVAERRVGFVFQSYALFRHMTVAQNIGFGLTVRKRRDRPTRAEIARRVQELLDLVQLGDLGKRYPAQLSGGQRQRVALARALAVEPKLLLLDEPFGALDAKVRKDLRRWLRDLHDRMGLTSIFVTHDQEEALELADRVVVMDHGVVEQVDTPERIYKEPRSAFVYSFVGDSNCLPVEASDGRLRYFDRAIDAPVMPKRDGSAKLYFRPHNIELAEKANGALPAIVTLNRPIGGGFRVEARLIGSDRPIEIDVAGDAAPEPGQRVAIKLKRARLYYDSDGGSEA